MQEILKDLESSGFTGYEAKVLLALFKGHSMTASEVAREAKIPRPSAHQILKSFAEKGICNEIQTTSAARYEIIDPKVVHEKLAREIKDAYQTRISRLDSSFKKLQPIFSSRELDAQKVDVELIKGYNKQRHSKFIELLKSSEKELLLMVKLERYVREETDREAKRFYQRGGIVKSVYEFSNDFKVKTNGTWENVTPQQMVSICENFVEQGEQAKIAESIPQNVAIFDRKVVYLSLVDPTIPLYNRSDVIIKNEGYAKFMAEHFEKYWNEAFTIEEFKKKIL